MTRQTHLLELIHAARLREEAFLSALDDSERVAPGSPTDWSGKDLIAHLADWRLRTAEGLDAISRGDSPVDYPEFDETNAVVYEQHRTQDWDEVTRLSARAWADLEAAVRRLSDDQLDAPSPLPSLGGRPVWRMVIIDACTHPLTHLGAYAVRRGRAADATRWEEDNAARLAALDASPAWRGTIRYNLACHYAVRGRSAEAIAALGDALRLNPDLREWSQQDGDLESLRGMEAYQALYQE